MNNRSPEQEASELPKAKASLLKEQTPDHGMRMLFLYGCLLGLVAFVGIVGIRVLNVGYVDWLMQKADGMQHYLGWLAYRQTPWTFPIGLTNALSYPFFTSVVYTDPIPLFAVFFKVLSPLLPATFQYFGIWALLCFMLQGGLAAILIYRFVQKKPLCLLGAAFFVLSMPLLMRALYHHEALMAQWIILLAIALWLYRVKENDMVKRCLIWAGMGLLCAGVHMYFIPMTGILLLGSMATDFYTHRKALRCIFPIASYLAASVCFLFLMGAFYGGINACADGAGAYVSNLNSLFNPLGKSTLFKALPVVSENYEGSAYLGAGMLLLCATASLALLQKGWKNPFETHLKKAYLLGAIVMLLLCVPLALGPHITLNGRILFTIPYPGLVLSAFSMFRASGRFVWILFYLSLLAILAISLRKLSQRAAYILLSVCLCLQIIDGFAVFRTLHSDYSAAQAAVNPLLKSELMQSFLGNPNYRHIEFLDALYETDYLQFAQYARQGNMSVSDFYFARRCEKTDLYRQDELKRVCGGAVSRDTIYVANSVSGHRSKCKLAALVPARRIRDRRRERNSIAAG